MVINNFNAWIGRVTPNSLLELELNEIPFSQPIFHFHPYRSAEKTVKY